MEVKKLQARIQDYKNYLQQQRELPQLEKWEALHHFQEYWDIDAPDFGEMYDQSLQSTITQRLWKRETWRPKGIMLQLIAQDSEFARRIFKNLLDETQSIEIRISKFKFACEEMLQEFKFQNKTTIENNHYHDDNEMILLYLTFAYPEVYTFYEYAPFAKTLGQMGITDIPSPYDLERFFKLTKILYTFLKKDEELMALHRAKRSTDQFYQDDSKMIVHDFYIYCGS